MYGSFSARHPVFCRISKNGAKQSRSMHFSLNDLFLGLVLRPGVLHVLPNHVASLLQGCRSQQPKMTAPDVTDPILLLGSVINYAFSELLCFALAKNYQFWKINRSHPSSVLIRDHGDLCFRITSGYPGTGISSTEYHDCLSRTSQPLGLLSAGGYFHKYR